MELRVKMCETQGWEMVHCIKCWLCEHVKELGSAGSMINLIWQGTHVIPALFQRDRCRGTDREDHRLRRGRSPFVCSGNQTPHLRQGRKARTHSWGCLLTSTCALLHIQPPRSHTHPHTNFKEYIKQLCLIKRGYTRRLWIGFFLF